MPITLDGSNGITTPTYGGADTSEYLVPVTQFKNRIINGAMVIDQRNAGASVTPSVDGTYTLDRWVFEFTQASKFSVQQNAGSVTPPSGFRNYLGVTVGASANVTVGAADYFALEQRIEGFNTADLMWGTSNAQTVTLSFWVRSSVTGTVGGALTNGGTRSYPFTYTISSANTWEYKTITIAGDTTGTWATGNTWGIGVFFSLGMGSNRLNTAGAWAGGNFLSATGSTNIISTNSATFYITGVQLEVGSTATSFDYRPYGTELALCQRYYQKSYAQATVPATATTVGSEVFVAAGTGGEASGSANLRVTMRATPTITVYSTATGASGNIRNGSTSTDIAVSSVQDTSDSKVGYIAASRTTGQIYSYQWIASIEL